MLPSFMRAALYIAALLPAINAAPVAVPEPEGAVAVQSIPGKYIVTLKPYTNTTSHINWVQGVQRRSLQARGAGATGGVENTYSINNFKGYSGTFDPAAVAEIEANPDVTAIEADQIWTISTMKTLSNSTWGLGSISHKTPNHTDYIYDTAAGQGNYAYVIDTGVLITHTQFGGRAINGYNAVPNTTFTDTDGHGTHVAGTVAGKTYGVAKKATIIAVKVFSGFSGSTSTILDGYNWAANDIISKNRQNTAVCSMSLGGGYSAAFNNAVQSAYNSSILTVVAAGNDNQNAKYYSPASAPNAITVGAIDITNARAGFSNYGAVLDIWAPGVNILSAWYTSNTATNILSGTSMAAPHITGLICYLRSLAGAGGLSASAVTSKLISLATTNVVTDASGSPKRIGYNGNGAK